MYKLSLESKYVLNSMLSCKSYSRYFDALPLELHQKILLPNLDDIQLCEIKQQNTKIPILIKLKKNWTFNEKKVNSYICSKYLPYFEGGDSFPLDPTLTSIGGELDFMPHCKPLQ
jgi:hypothetical protein